MSKSIYIINTPACCGECPMSGTDVCRKWSMKEARTFPKACPLKPYYDVDKVVEQLEKDTEFAYNRYIDCSPNAPQSVHVRYFTQYQERKRCLDIVKSSVTE